MSGQPQVGAFAQTACLWEATARKVGNVHRFADFEDLTYLDFLLSAAAIAEPMTMACLRPLGQTILASVEARTRVTATNANLGIILLLAPLAAVPEGEGLREGVRRLLAETTLADSVAAFEAIRLAKPGGLGAAAKEDVANAPTLPFQQIMTMAADRDAIAKQYATVFEDVFEFGVPNFLEAYERFGSIESAIIECQLRWLARTPDSLISRKCGEEVAMQVQSAATSILQLGGIATAEGRAAGVSFDGFLRSDGHCMNPGTTADLITAVLFVALREHRVSPASPFAWSPSGWLSPWQLNGSKSA